jgi:hypothetical protein
VSVNKSANPGVAAGFFLVVAFLMAPQFTTPARPESKRIIADRCEQAGLGAT